MRQALVGNRFAPGQRATLVHEHAARRRVIGIAFPITDRAPVGYRQRAALSGVGAVSAGTRRETIACPGAGLAERSSGIADPRDDRIVIRRGAGLARAQGLRAIVSARRIQRKAHAVAAPLRTIALRSGAAMPSAGLRYLARMGERAATGASSGSSLRSRQASELGVTLIDTAEMYGERRSRKNRRRSDRRPARADVFWSSKVPPPQRQPARRGRRVQKAQPRPPGHAITSDPVPALHWRGDVPLPKARLPQSRRCRPGRQHPRLGASRISAAATPRSRWRFAAVTIARPIRSSITSARAASSRILSRSGRGAGVALMAYSPLDQGRLLRERALQAIAARVGATPGASRASAWLLQQRDVAVIPEGSRRCVHVHDNFVRCATRHLGRAACEELDRAFSSTAPRDLIARMLQRARALPQRGRGRSALRQGPR